MFSKISIHIFFFKQKTAYEMRISDWSSDMCSSDLTHHIVDIVRRFPVPGITAQGLIGALRPLQPRLYSIASSLAAAPDEAHLTVAPVGYALPGEPPAGVASGMLAARAAPDTGLSVYIQSRAAETREGEGWGHRS